MKHSNTSSLFLSLLNPFVIAGIGLLIVWMLTKMAFLSWADLSYVGPITAVGYVLSVFSGHLFLNEHITPQRWLGTVLIMLGTAIVSRTAPRTS